jgi:hypothetical protein
VFLGQEKEEVLNENASYYAIKRVPLDNVNWKKVKENFRI